MIRSESPSPLLPPGWRSILLVWLAWYIALMGFQQLNWARFTIERPDDGYAWTRALTGGAYDGPETGAWFYARWDSYRFVRIAQEGYSDPILATFFPGYSLLMRAVDGVVLAPMMDEDAAASRMALAGIIVSGITSGIAALGMYSLAYARLGGSADATRAAFYMLIFPTAMFMVQLYT
ncbi:MAG: hypothetical protein ACLFTK_17800, partial [Anaerolineales bacterium]